MHSCEQNVIYCIVIADKIKVYQQLTLMSSKKERRGRGLKFLPGCDVGFRPEKGCEFTAEKNENFGQQ